MTDLNRIFLVGPMGAGKTTIGKHLARILSLRFVDSDQEIERRTGATIPWIFDLEGEDGFRSREAAMIDELTQQPGIILATGGGAVLLAENRLHLRDRGTVIYLTAPLDELFARAGRDRNRPLLQTDSPKTRLERLVTERDPLYREVADVVVDTSTQPLGPLVDSLAANLRRLLSNNPTSDSEGKN